MVGYEQPLPRPVAQLALTLPAVCMLLLPTAALSGESSAFEVTGPSPLRLHAAVAVQGLRVAVWASLVRQNAECGLRRL
jgi:hypothetical protein